MTSLHLFISFLDNHWLILSFAAPVLWALVNIIDVYFVKGVYQDELDGTIISGLFQIIPCVFLLFFMDVDAQRLIIWGNGNFFWVDPAVPLALLGGALYTGAFYFYFRSLFSRNDAALLQIIWSLTIVAVPLLSFFVWGERLLWHQYVGMGVTFLGVVMLSLNKTLQRKFSWQYCWSMLGAVLLLSLSMVAEDGVYSILAAKGFGNQGFLIGFICFLAGAFLAGAALMAIKRRNPAHLIKKYFKIFLVAEGIAFFGTLTSQRAIDIAPSVSYVATIETFVPVFILFFSLLMLFYYSLIVRHKSGMAQSIYHEQLDGFWIKIIATTVMAVGVYVISL